jgi:internalin A
MLKFKKLLCKFFSLLVILSIISSFTFADASVPSDIIRFSDKNLEQAVRDKLSLPLGDILKSKVAGVTSLDLSSKDIKDISPLQFFTGLKVLKLDSNQITDISSLSTLTNMEELHLDSNQITDISALSSMSNLQILYLQYNQVKDIHALTDLIKLKKIFLGTNLITDISPLGKQSDLEWLYLGDNRIEDIRPISNLTKLQFLELGSNRISDISSLSTLKELIFLNICSTDISDISSLKDMTNLWSLWAFDSKIKDISPLSGKPNLIEAYLQRNEITGDIGTLENLPMLSTLNLSNNYIEGISSLGALKELTSLNLEFNKISDISKMSGLTGLQKLNLSNNNIKDINALAELPNLTELDISDTKMKDIRPLNKLTNLTKLNLGFNEISDITPLSSLKNLEELDLTENEVSNISALSSTRSLRILELTRNKVSDLKPLSKLQSMQELSLVDNKIEDIRPLSELSTLSGLWIDGNRIKDYTPLKSLYDESLSQRDFLFDGIYVNGKAIQRGEPLTIIQGVSIAAIRDISEELGAEVLWEGKKGTITVHKKADRIIFTLGSNIVTVNGKKEKLPIAVKFESGKTYVPVRFLSEKLRAKVEWNKATKTVEITGNYSEENKTTRILFLGNSMTYSNHMPGMIEKIAESMGKNVKCDITPLSSGNSLKNTWEDGVTRKLIAKGNWDYVSLQDIPGYPVNNREQYNKYVRLFDADIDKAGAKTVIYNCNDTRGADGLLRANSEILKYNSEKLISDQIGGLHVPAAMSWINMSEKDPGAGKELYSDGLHPSQMGAYLIACVYYASIFNESPEGASAKFTVIPQGTDTKVDFDLSNRPELVKLLQKTAWETVQKYR